MHRSKQYFVLGLTLLACAGCRAWVPEAPTERTLLRPVEMASDGVQLEIVSVRFPYADATLNGDMWSEIDEQQLPPDQRRDLAENGFRAGIVSGQLPTALQQLITAAEQPGTVTEASANFGKAPAVSKQQMQLHSGWHGQIFASSTYPELPLLTCRNGTVCGRTYSQAQCILNTTLVAQDDQKVKLQLMPELDYGEARQQWVTDEVTSVSQALNRDGVLRPQSGKPKQMFDRLSFDAMLAPGQMLLLTTLPERSGSLGHFFFTDEQSEQTEQKLLIVRLAQSKTNDLFSTADSTNPVVNSTTERTK